MSVRREVLLTGARVYRHDGDTDLPPVQDILIADGVIGLSACHRLKGPSRAPDCPLLARSGHRGWI
jgi:hypothetical protein